MTNEEIVKLMVDVKPPVYLIEKELNMPAGTLAKAVKGTRNLPKAWEQPLRDYVAGLKGEASPKEKLVDGITEETIPNVMNEKGAIMDVKEHKEFFEETGLVLTKAAEEPLQNSNEPPAVNSVFNEEKINARIKELSWVATMEKFCEDNSITPQDLMDSYGKKPVKEKKIVIDRDLLPGSRADGEDYVANPVSRRMQEPQEGTNAFYMRYGAYTHAEAKKLKKPDVKADLLPAKK